MFCRNSISEKRGSTNIVFVSNGLIFHSDRLRHICFVLIPNPRKGPETHTRNSKQVPLQDWHIPSPTIAAALLNLTT